MAQSYDFIPPGKKLVGKRLVNDTGKDEPSAFETIERLKAQIRVLEQRVKSDEISDLALSLEAARKGLAHANEQVVELEQKVASLEATIEAQRQTIATQDDEAKMLRKAVAVKRGDTPPPLSPDMKEMAGLQEQLAAAKQRITDLETAAESKDRKKKEK
jgi:chromosome segregation ATPase